MFWFSPSVDKGYNATSVSTTKLSCSGEFAVLAVVLVNSVLSEILGANEVASDVYDELSSTK